LRLKPDRAVEEGQMMVDTVIKLLHEGIRQRLFAIATAEDDAKVFLYSIAYFFPSALNEPPIPPVEADLATVVDWFLRVWRGEAPRRGGAKARKTISRPTARRAKA
jgi:hypothetical protein